MKVVTFETMDGKVRYLLVDAGGIPIEAVNPDFTGVIPRDSSSNRSRSYAESSIKK